MSTTADNQNRVTQAIAEYMRRVDAGEAVDSDAFIKAHSEVAEDLKRYLDNVALVEQMAGPTPAEQSQSPGQDASRRETVSASQGGDSIPEQKSSATDGPLSGAFGRYKIEKTLGEGAMGTVYLANDTQLDRRVALKIPKFKDDDAEMMERFYREARSAARLRHRHICPVHDIGEIDGIKYISIAYIEGHQLSAYVSPDKPQSERNIAIIVRKLALALQVAHNEGIIHRDLKPANVMVDKKTEPVIMDFGLARQMNTGESERLTQTGAIMGSPAYMSPEQVDSDDDKMGPCSDVYSLGVMLYELLTGRLPFEGSIAAVIGQILMKEPEKPSTLRPDLDPRLEEICAKMMAKQVEERYTSMKEVADALTKVLKNKNKTSSKRTADKLVSFAPVELQDVKEKPKKQRRTKPQPADQPRQKRARTKQAGGKRKPSVDAKHQTAFDRLKNLSGRAKAIAGGCAALLLVLGITVIIKVGDQTLELTTTNPHTKVEIEGDNVKVTTGGTTSPANDTTLPSKNPSLPPKLDDLTTGTWIPILTSATDFKADEKATATLKDGVLELSNTPGERTAKVDLVTAPRGSNVILRAEVNLLAGHDVGLWLESADTSANYDHVNAHLTKNSCVLWRTHLLSQKGGGAPVDLPADKIKKGFRDFAVALVDGRIAAYLDGERIVERANWSEAKDFAPGLHVFSFERNGKARAQFRNVRMMLLDDKPSDLPAGQWVRLLENEEQFKQWQATNCDVKFAEGTVTLADMENEQKTERGDGRLERLFETTAQRFIVHIRHNKRNGHMAGEDVVAGSQRFSASHFGIESHELWALDDGNTQGSSKLSAYISSDGYADFADFDYVVIDGEFSAYLNGKKMHNLKRTAAPLSSIKLDVRRARGQWKDIAVMRLTDEQVAAIRAGELPSYIPAGEEHQRPDVLVRTAVFNANIQPVRFTPDGRYVLGIHWGSLRLVVHDAATGKQIRQSDVGVRTQEEDIHMTALAVSPLGMLAAGSSSNGKLLLWDYETGKLKHELKGHTRAVREAVFTADGKRLLTSSREGTMIWNVDSGERAKFHTLVGGPAVAGALAVSPDGAVFAEGRNRFLKLRNAETGQVVWGNEEQRKSDFQEIVFSSDGKRLIAYVRRQDASRIVVYDIADGTVQTKFVPTPATRAKGAVELQLLKNDELLLVTHSAGPVALWDITSGRLLQEIDGAASADVSLDGRTIVTKGPEYSVRLWQVDEEKLRSARSGQSPTNVPSHTSTPFNATQANAHQTAWAKHLGVPTKTKNSQEMHLVLIPPGEFDMGTSEEDSKKYKGGEWIKDREYPVRRIRLTRPFYLGGYEVTQRQFEQVMGSNPSHHTATGEGKDKVKGLQTGSHPVENVSWLMAVEFCNRLSVKEDITPFYAIQGESVVIQGGSGYRLPTEAEWEYACRAGTQTAYSFGEDPSALRKFGWAHSDQTHPVGQKLPNAFGLFDMHGNVWERCYDRLGSYDQHQSPIDPTGPTRSRNRVCRGGGINGGAPLCRCATRSQHKEDTRVAAVGFRVARTILVARPPEPPAITADNATYNTLRSGSWQSFFSKAEDIPQDDRITFKDGKITLDDRKLRIPGLKARNVAVRVRIKKETGRGFAIDLRTKVKPEKDDGTLVVSNERFESEYGFWGHGPKTIAGINCLKSGSNGRKELTKTTLDAAGSEFELLVAAIDDRLLYFADGKLAMETRDTSISEAGEIALGSYSAKFTMSNVAVRVLDGAGTMRSIGDTVSSADGWVDLLPFAATALDTEEGKWRLVANELVGSGKYSLPIQPDQSFEWETTFTLSDSGGYVNFAIPDQFGFPFAEVIAKPGLKNYKPVGSMANTQLLQAAPAVSTGEKHVLHVSHVNQDNETTITVTIDGKTWAEWSGKAQDLESRSVVTVTNPQIVGRRKITIHSSRLRMLDGEAKLLRHGGQSPKPELVAVLKGDDRSFNGVDFTADGRRVIAAGQTGQISQWDVASGALISRTETDRVEALALAPDGNMLVTAHKRPQSIRLWDLKQMKEIRKLSSTTGYRDYQSSITFSPDGKTVSAVASDFVARIWDVATGKQLHEFSVRHAAETSSMRSSEIVYSPDGRFVLARAAAEKPHRVYVFDLEKGKIDESLSFESKHPTYGEFAISPDGRELALTDYGNSLRFVDWIAKTPAQAIEFSRGQRAVKYSPDGKLLAIASYDKLALFESATRKQIATLPLQNNDVRAGSIAFSPDGRFLAVAEKFKHGQNPPATPPGEFYVRIWRLPELPVENQAEASSKVAGTEFDQLTAGSWTRVLNKRSEFTKVPDARLTATGILVLGNAVKDSDAHVGIREATGDDYLQASDFALRMKVKRQQGRNFYFLFRQVKSNGYVVSTNGRDVISAIRKIGFAGLERQITGPQPIEVDDIDWVEWMLVARGKTMTVYADGRIVMTFSDSDFQRGGIAIGADQSRMQFKEVELQLLDSGNVDSNAVPPKSVPTRQWLAPKVNSDEIKRAIAGLLKNGFFGKPPDTKAMEKYTIAEVARRKADGRMSPNGKIEYRFNSVGKIVFESASDSPAPSGQNKGGGGTAKKKR